MAVEILQVPMDADLKNSVEKLYRDMGINFAEAIRQFAKKSVELGAAPFAMETETAFGALAKYANPELIPLEKDAWERAVAEKYGEKTD